MAFLVQTRGVRSALQSIQADVEDRSRYARRLIGTHSVQRLRAGDTLVNVDTGKMRDSFTYKVARGNNRIDIFNSATSPRGFRYPILIERRYRGAERTLNRSRTRIVNSTLRDLNRPVRRGRLPYERA